MPLISTPTGKLDVEHIGEGRDLILLHSLLTDRSAFDRVAPALAKRRRLCLVNLPGYGSSEPQGQTVDAYADAVAGMIQTLKLPQQTDVLGNGLGGFTALALAIRHGALFDRLIIVDALAGFPEAGKGPLRALSNTVREQGMAAGLDAAIRRMFPPAYIEAHPEVVEERKRVLRRMNPETFSSLCLALASTEMAAQLPQIRNPTLVLAGALDATTAPDLVRKVAEGIPGARFAEIPGCGHCPQIEKPEAFLDLLEPFLAGG
jgi:3-oxoadipate enol-lactonase